MKINCKKCRHVWSYKGESEYYITCPRCYTKINLKKLKEKIKNELMKNENQIK